jgi:predicted PurR-regulated permease PerM
VRPGSSAPRDGRFTDRLRGIARDALNGAQKEIGSVVRLGPAVIGAMVRGVFTGVLILMIAAFVLLDIERITSFVRGLVPLGYRADYDVVATGVHRGLNGVIRGQLVICMVNGVLTWVGLVLFRIDYTLLLASVAAIMSLIPIFGSILSTLPIVVTALVSGGDGLDLQRGLFITLWIIGIHMLEANYLNPRIIGTAAKIHPVLVVFALVLGEHTYGLTGALLAVPVASVVQFMFIFFRSRAWRTEGAAAAP